MERYTRQIRIGGAAVMIAASFGSAADSVQAATPHPLTLGLKTIELACHLEGGQAPEADYGSAYCGELSRLLGERLRVEIEQVVDAGPASSESLPRVGTIWIRTVLSLRDDAAWARTSWGSYAPQRGVPASEDGAPVSLPLEGLAPESVATTLAGMVVNQMPFVPGA